VSAVAELAVGGGCLCGAVRYLLSGRPSASMACHCDSCARASGAPAVAWVTFAREQVSVVRGAPIAFHSSPPVTRRFCGACGTALFYEHAQRPTEIDVTTRTLDDPDLFPPTHHAWLGDAPAWDRPGDGLPQFERDKQDP
jgi:hypothetical protein